MKRSNDLSRWIDEREALARRAGFAGRRDFEKAEDIEILVLLAICAGLAISLGALVWWIAR